MANKEYICYLYSVHNYQDNNIELLTLIKSKLDNKLLFNLLNKARNVNIHGAMCHTLRVLAMQATLGFHDGHVSRIAQANLVKVVGADFGFLLRHRDALLLVEGFF